jgi:hypothetical protein
MDLLKNRNQRDKNNQELIKDILDEGLVQRYRFGSLAEMSLIRELILDKIMKDKLKTQDDLKNFDKIKSQLTEYFYVEKMEQIDCNDYVRYITFTEDGFELKNGGIYVNTKDNFVVLKNGFNNENKKFWKISDKTPIFCKLTDEDKMLMVLMENLS